MISCNNSIDLANMHLHLVELRVPETGSAIYKCYAENFRLPICKCATIVDVRANTFPCSNHVNSLML